MMGGMIYDGERCARSFVEAVPWTDRPVGFTDLRGMRSPGEHARDARILGRQGTGQRDAQGGVRELLNFLDTAASYGDAESERRIGEVLKDIGRLPEDYVLATKADRDLSTVNFSGDQMRRSVERSLKLLGLERLQLVYLHDPEHLNEPGREAYEYMMAAGGPAIMPASAAFFCDTVGPPRFIRPGSLVPSATTPLYSTPVS
jgi:hypothetical protein